MTTVDVKHMDALSYLRTLPDSSINLIMTDPPYDIRTDGSGKFGKRRYFSQMEGIQKGVSKDMLDEMMRVMIVPNIYIWCNTNQIPFYIDYFVNTHHCNFDLLTWHKTNPTPTCNNKYLPDTEYCLYFRKGAKLYGNYHSKHKYWITSVNRADKGKYNHPMCKPVDIIMQLVSNSTLEGESVCDPFMGSGTTAEACARLNRSCYGCDIVDEYVKTTLSRVTSIHQR